MPKTSTNFFFLLSFHHGFTNEFEIKFSCSQYFSAFSADFFLVLPSKFIAPWRCSYQMSKTIILSSYVEGQVQKNQVSVSCLWLVFKASKIWLFFSKNLLDSKFSKYFQAEIITWSPMFFWFFLTWFHMVWKNQERILISLVFS